MLFAIIASIRFMFINLIMLLISTKNRSQSCNPSEVVNVRWIRRLYPLAMFVISLMCLLVLFDKPSSSSYNREDDFASHPHQLIAADLNLVNHRELGPFRAIYSLKRSSYSSDQSESTLEASSHRLLDMDNFVFHKNASKTCQDNDSVNLICFVHTSLANFRRREIIRETWASKEIAKEINLKIIFLVGISDDGDDDMKAQINNESIYYDDIVQGNFIDSYRNLTYKHLMGFKWVLTFCRHAKFVMKVDDDAYVDIYRVVHVLNDLSNERSRKSMMMMSGGQLPLRANRFTNSIHYLMMETTKSRFTNLQPQNIFACSVFPEGIKVKRYGKWQLTVHDYPFDTFPSYCSGIAYFLTPDILQDLYRASSIVRPFLWIDDLFITGILAAQFPISKHSLNFKFTYSPRDLRNWLKIKQLSPSPHMIGDIGDVDDWESLMIQLWTKTAQVWQS